MKLMVIALGALAGGAAGLGGWMVWASSCGGLAREVVGHVDEMIAIVDVVEVGGTFLNRRCEGVALFSQASDRAVVFWAYEDRGAELIRWDFP